MKLVALITIILLKIFTKTYNDSCSYSLVDSTKPLKFDDPPFESLGTCHEVEVV